VSLLRGSVKKPVVITPKSPTSESQDDSRIPPVTQLISGGGSGGLSQATNELKSEWSDSELRSNEESVIPLSEYDA
jgi:hypothetical protein